MEPRETDPESGDRVTPVPDTPVMDMAPILKAWRESEQGCWQEGPGHEDD